MAFKDKKVEKIMSLNPDILIIQECANIDKLNLSKFPKKPSSDPIWYGHNPNKGIAVFGFNGIKLSVIQEPDENDKWIIPIKVTGSENFTLIAVWAMNHRKNKVFKGEGPFFASLKRLEKLLLDKVIIAGDLNDNKIWDKGYYKTGSFSDVSAYFESKGIISCYHATKGETYGQEKEKTIWWRKNLKTGYHIDYCFSGKKWSNRLQSFEIGKPADWMSLSDHVPIVIDFKENLG